MKKSHRKDVIIARIIFACMVVILIAVIVFGTRAIFGYRAENRQTHDTEAASGEDRQEVETGSESGSEEADDFDRWIVDTEETETTEDTEQTETTEAAEESGADGQVLLEAQYGVNIRSGAGKDYPVVGGVEEGTTIILLEDQGNGWGYIQRDDLTGYVYLDYFRVVDGE